MKSLLNWLDHRTGFRALMHEALFERIPGGARWRYVWGSTLVFTFTVQMISGIFLWMAYSPSAQTAWESVYYIQTQMTWGWLVRGIHHFAAQAMVVLMALHLMQVIIDGAYKAPREVNYWLGLILMQIVLGLSLTGYLLPWDQKGYYATQVATEIAGATPVVGPQIQQLAQGGPQYGHHTLTRFFALHTGVLPGALIFFLALHIYVFRRHGITVPDPNRAPETTFWPDQVLKDAVACLAVLMTILVCAVYFHGAELSSPANPAEAYSAARPEWYFLFLFRFLKYEWVEHLTNGPAFGAIYAPGAIMTILILMPFIAKWKAGHKLNVAFLWLVVLGAVYLTGVAMWEDKSDASHQAAVKEAIQDGHRTVELSNAFGIPAEGALALRRTDPLTQGPRIFAQSCAACHRYNGHDGRGSPVLVTVNKERVAAPPTAADLGNFGTREWITAVLTDYDKTFSPLRNSDWYKTLKEAPENKDNANFVGFPGSEMADWCATNKEALLKKDNEKHLKGLVEFLASQAKRPGEKYDEVLVALGRTVAIDGTLASGELSVSCSGCHGDLSEEAFKLSDEKRDYPVLTGYGSAEWLRNFLENPARHYGDKNQMPAYAEKLSQSEFDLLIRWLTGDYYKPKHGGK